MGQYVGLDWTPSLAALKLVPLPPSPSPIPPPRPPPHHSPPLTEDDAERILHRLLWLALIHQHDGQEDQDEPRRQPCWPVAELASSACALAVCPSQCPPNCACLPNCAAWELASSFAAPNRDKGMDAFVSTFAHELAEATSDPYLSTFAHAHSYTLLPLLSPPLPPHPLPAPSVPAQPNCAAWELASSLAAPNRDKGMDALCLPNCAAWELASSLAAPNRDKGMDALVSTFAHELAEATSDPYLSTWMNEKGEENADMCSYSELAVATSDRHLSTWMNDKGEENVDMCSYRCVCLQVRFGLLWCSAVDGMIGLAETTSDPYLSTWMDE
ncbi:unnamed protein product [Closterium sp. Naga37s-1]|nr:unnamed protein product [Closterium sp. Naga37s-1]